MNHKEYFIECLNKSAVAVLYFEKDMPQPVFVEFQEKSEDFESDTWMFCPNGIEGMMVTFTDEDIAKANISYDEEEDIFNIAFVNPEELCEDGYEGLNRIQFYYTKKDLI